MTRERGEMLADFLGAQAGQEKQVAPQLPVKANRSEDVATLQRLVPTRLYRSEEEICADVGYDATDAKT